MGAREYWERRCWPAWLLLVVGMFLFVWLFVPAGATYVNDHTDYFEDQGAVP